MTIVVLLVATSLGAATGAAPTRSVKLQPALLVRAGRSDDVYLVASTGCASARCVRFYRTTISADHPLRVATLPVKGERGGIANSTLDRLVFANVNDGYAEVGATNPLALYATTNGARSWRRVTSLPGGDLLDLVTTSSEVFAETARCSARQGSCVDYHVWRSSLATRRWTALPVLWRTGSRPDENYYGPLVSALGHTVWELEDGFNAVHLWTSYDNGQHFTSVATPALGSVAGCYLTPMSKLDIWAECPTGLEVSFLASSDGGIRWPAISRDVFSGTGGGAFDPVSGQIAYLDYGLVKVRGFNLYRITDGGRSARALGDLACTSVSLLFFNVSEGLADCGVNNTSSHLERTTDGGSKWTSVVIPAS